MARHHPWNHSRYFLKNAIWSVSVFCFLFFCQARALAQISANKNVSDIQSMSATPVYKPTAYPMDNIGEFSIGPIIPTLAGGPHLFGDWHGAQPWLLKHGIFLNFSLNEEFMGNVTGGRTRANVLAGQVAGELDIDWQRLAGIDGFWTHMLVINGHGRSFSYTLGDFVTNPEQIYGARGNVVAHLVWA